MQKSKTLGVVITDGVGYRNFIMSNFIGEVSRNFEKVIIYSGLPKGSYSLSLFPKNIKIIELPLYKETKPVWFFRKLKEVAHMQLHKNFYGIKDNLDRGYPITNSKRALLVKGIYRFSNFFHSERAINKYEYFQFKAFSRDKVTMIFEGLLKEEKPNILFFTHQRPPFLAPLLYLAQKLKIRTTSFIFSWDNLASKGRMMGNFDSYLVWSDLMKTELQHFYPQTKKNKIHIVGTPQFEPYVMEDYNMSRTDFCEKFKLDSTKKIICYSCADADIGRNDEIHIRGIISYIEKKKNLQLLVRTSPAEVGKRFEKLINEFPEVKWNIPKWQLTRDNHSETWSQRIPMTEDLIDLKSVLKYSDISVNMCSTMSLDFMLFDKPVINTVFGNKKNGLYDDQRFLNYVHYNYVINSKAVTIAMNEYELHKQLDESLNNGALRKTYRENLIKLEIGKPLEMTSERIVKLLIQLCK